MSEDATPNTDEKKQLKEELNEADAVNAEVDLDDSKAKFLNGGKGIDDDSHFVVEVSQSPPAPFQGLKKEELMQYVNDPFWKRLRIILFVLFWLGWLAMLVAAIVIIVFAPRCPYRPDLKWYNKESVYRVCAKSYMDSDGDGFGDLKGLKSKVPYIKELGAKAISFGSIFKQDAHGAVIDHKDVDPIIGTVEEMEKLLDKYKKLGPKIIIDFIPNHTSRNHTWFLESRKSKDNDFADYYVWADAKNGGQPNNWRNLKGGSAWTLDPVRNQYYLGQKGSEYPDLNHMHEALHGEMETILRFWLDRGIGGFNLLDANLLVENSSLADESVIGTGNFYDDLDHEMTANNPHNIEIINKFRKVIDQYSNKPGRERVLCGVVEDMPENASIAYYGTDDMPGMHVVIGDQLTKITHTCGSICIKDIIDKQLTRTGPNNWLGWMLGNELVSRVSQRMGTKLELAALVLQFTLPGTSVMYYGDEIGMKDGVGQNPYTSPMQWSPEKNAGFTSGTPWTTINQDYEENNVASEEAHFKKSNILTKVRELLALRGYESFQFGKTTTGINGDMFWFHRSATGFNSYLVAINFGSQSVTHLFSGMSGSAEVVFHTHEDVSEIGDVDIASKYFVLNGGEAIILKLL